MERETESQAFWAGYQEGQYKRANPNWPPPENPYRGPLSSGLRSAFIRGYNTGMTTEEPKPAIQFPLVE